MANTTGLIVSITQGMVPPKQYLQMAYAKFPTYGSSVSLIEGENPELMIAGEASLPPLDKLMEDLETNKDVPTLLYFAHSKTPLSAESEQPFPIIRDDKKNPRMVGYMEGDYFDPENGDSPHSDEYHMFLDVLGPQLSKIYTKMCKGDLAQFEEELLDPDTVKLIDSLVKGNRGVVTLQSISGKLFKFEKGNDEIGGEYPWGWVSQNLGFVEQSSKEYTAFKEPEAEPVKRTMGNRFGNKKPAVQVTSAVPAKPTTIHKQNEPEPPKTEGAVKVIEDAARPMIGCPPDIIKKGKNAMWDWYDKNCLGRPTKEGGLAGVLMPADDAYIAANSGKFGKLADKAAEMKAKIEASKANLQDSPFITPKLKTIINEMLDSGAVKAKTESGRILSADELKAPPTVAPWSVQMGRDLMEVFRWDHDIFDRFLIKCRDEKDFTPAILLYKELVHEQLKMLLDSPSDTKAEEKIKPPATNNEGDSIGGKLPKGNEVFSTQPDKVDDTSASPPAAKPKGNRFASRKAA